MSISTASSSDRARHAGAAVTLLAAALFGATAHAQAQTSADTAAVAARLRQAFPGMPASARVEATVVPGIYAMRVPGFTGCPVFTDMQVSMVANNGRRGWAMVATGQPLSESRSRELMATIYRSLPEVLIPIGDARESGKGSGMVLISGVDCQPSAQIEASLAARRVGYRILPAALNEAHLGLARDAACARDGAGAWQAIRRTGSVGSAGRNPACQVDVSMLKDIPCMVMGGRLPSALFADGRFSQHPNEIAGLSGER